MPRPTSTRPLTRPTPRFAPSFARNLALSAGLHGLALAALVSASIELHRASGEPAVARRIVVPAASSVAVADFVEAREEPEELEYLDQEALDEEPVLQEVSWLPFERMGREREPLLEDVLFASPLEPGDWTWSVARLEESAPESAPPAPVASEPPPRSDEPAPEAEGGSEPVLVASPSPAYPGLSIRRGEQGSVTCRLHVSAAGRVSSVEVVRSSGHARLDAAAVEALTKWRFRPARRAGVPVDATLLHEVVFRLTS